MKNKSLLTKIGKTSKVLQLIINSSLFTADKMGRWMKDLKVWYNPKSIANILGYHHLVKYFCIVSDTSVEDALFVKVNSR